MTLNASGEITGVNDAFAPTTAEVDLAVEILGAAQAAAWAPIRHHDTLHDRASYRFYWQVLERAHQTGHTLPETVRHWFAPAPTLAAAAGFAERH